MLTLLMNGKKYEGYQEVELRRLGVVDIVKLFDWDGEEPGVRALLSTEPVALAYANQFGEELIICSKHEWNEAIDEVIWQLDVWARNGSKPNARPNLELRILFPGSCALFLCALSSPSKTGRGVGPHP